MLGCNHQPGNMQMNEALVKQQWQNNYVNITRPKKMSEICQTIVYDMNSMDSNFKLYSAKKKRQRSYIMPN